LRKKKKGGRRREKSQWKQGPKSAIPKKAKEQKLGGKPLAEGIGRSERGESPGRASLRCETFAKSEEERKSMSELFQKGGGEPHTGPSRSEKAILVSAGERKGETRGKNKKS